MLPYSLKKGKISRRNWQKSLRIPNHPEKQEYPFGQVVPAAFLLLLFWEQELSLARGNTLARFLMHEDRAGLKACEGEE